MATVEFKRNPEVYWQGSSGVTKAWPTISWWADCTGYDLYSKALVTIYKYKKMAPLTGWVVVSKEKWEWCSPYEGLLEPDFTGLELEPGDTIKIEITIYAAEWWGGDELVRYDLSATASVTTIIPTEFEPNITIEDLYNNKFRATCSYTSGFNNEAKDLQDLAVFYYYNNTTVYFRDTQEVSTLDDGRTKHTYVIEGELNSTNTDPTETVNVCLDLTDRFGTDSSISAAGQINKYVAPSLTGNIDLSYILDGKGRGPLLTCDWDEASSINNTSPVKGYKVILEKAESADAARTSVANLAYDSSNNYIIYDSDGSTGEIFTDSTNTTVRFYPKDFGIKTGRYFYIYIIPYTRYGENNESTRLLSDSSIESSAEVPGGMLRVRVDDEWKKGHVFVCIEDPADGTLKWKQSDAVYVVNNGAFKESTIQ